MLALGTCRPGEVETDFRLLGGRRVGYFRLVGGPSRGAIGPVEGEAIVRLVETATEIGVPIVGVLATSGADVDHGIASLAAWGRIARALVNASGVVPIAIAVVGPCVAGPSLLIGLADIVAMTRTATAFVTGPRAVEQMTGVGIDAFGLGGSGIHAIRSGVAALDAEDEDGAVAALVHALGYLPPNNLEQAPAYAADDPIDRDSVARVPDLPNAAYDVRTVVDEVTDRGSLLELWPRHAGNIVTGFARVAGKTVGVVANQPASLAGTIDIAASCKGARFVQLCDAFNVPLLTFVDTPGFQPGRDLEWRGMIRHGAKLVHTYAAASVPRVCVILRKAYGGAYIVMDSRGMGNDFCVAWPSAEIAVMGASGAVQVLHGRKQLSEAELAVLVKEYEARYCTPDIAAERGYVDAVIEPIDTRRIVADALNALGSKRETLPRRHHSNPPQ